MAARSTSREVKLQPLAIQKVVEAIMASTCVSLRVKGCIVTSRIVASGVQEC